MRSAPRRLCVWAAILAISLAATARAQMLDRRWARSLPECSSYAVSPEGGVVVAANTDGLVQGFGPDGGVLWRARFPSEVRCAVSAGGALVVAYMPSSERNRTLVFLNARGQKVRTETAPAAVKDVRVSDAGRVVAVLSADSRITVFRHQRSGWRWQRRRISGTVTSFAMDAGGRHFVIGRSHPSGVSLLYPDLRTRWHWVGREDTTYQVHMDRDGKQIAALALSGPGRVSTALSWDPDRAEPRWSRPLKGDLAHIAITPHGTYLTADYRTRLRFHDKSAVEWRVGLFTRSGRLVWEVGGLMFGAHLIGPTGLPLLVLTHDGNRVLAALDSGGHMRARYRLPAPVVSTALSDDATHFAVMTEAHVLYLFRTRR